MQPKFTWKKSDGIEIRAWDNFSLKISLRLFCAKQLCSDCSLYSEETK